MSSDAVGREDLPSDWPQVPEAVLAGAKQAAMSALAMDDAQRAQDRLSRFYDVTSDYAGRSFAELAPVDTDDVTAVDLHATSLLSVDIGPAATRRLLHEGEHRRSVLENLRRVAVSDLATADSDTLLAMAGFYRAVKLTLSSTSAQAPNPWVTASKLCARKRPSLFPVRDRNVCELLGITKLNDFRLDWQVFRHLVRDDDVSEALQSLVAAVFDRTNAEVIEMDDGALRRLDAALWTYTVWYRSGTASGWTARTVR